MSPESVPHEVQLALTDLRAYAAWAGDPPVLTLAAELLEREALGRQVERAGAHAAYEAMRRLGREHDRLWRLARGNAETGSWWDGQKWHGMSVAYFAAANKLSRVFGFGAKKRTQEAPQAPRLRLVRER